MENYVTMLPVAAQPLIDFSDAEDAVIIEDPVVQSSVSFLDANTNAISLEDLASTCVVPTWGNQDLTISHQDFINCIHEAAKDFYRGETVNDPSIRVSHIVRGRTPDALGKRASELLECEKTQFYQRMAFAFTIPTIFESINGQNLNCVLVVSVITRISTSTVRIRVWRRFPSLLAGVSAFAQIRFLLAMVSNCRWK